MRKAWGRCAWIAIGMCGASATASHAREVRFIAVAGAALAPGVAKPMLADNVLRLPATPSPRTDSVASAHDRYFEPHALPVLRPGVLSVVSRSMRARGSAMTDVYLHGLHGFRLSAGSSLRVDYTAPDYGPAAAAGPAALMRLPIGAVNLRDGYESYAPVALVGYDHALSSRLKIGIEGGAMRGRAAAIYPVESMPTEIPPDRAGINPVADMVMTYLF